MHYQLIDSSVQKELVDLFTKSFTAAESKAEGMLVGALAGELAAEIDNENIICIGAYDNKLLAGAIFFTRLYFGDSTKAYMLAPVAINCDFQKKGIGQALINHGCELLKERGVSFVVTYGDPAFYVKVGFEPLSEEVIKAPLPLSMPFGWQGRTLTDLPIATISTPPTCVTAFNDPVLW